MRKLPISHIITNAAALKTEAEKVQYLQQHNSTALTTVLQYALDKRAKWDLPAGDPPYKPSDLTFDNEGMLYSEARRLYLFLEGGNPNLTQFKREMLFIGLLESIHPDDSKIILMAKNKKMPKGITKKIVNLAFPGLIDDGEE
jgi:hypothetical protein